MKDKLSIIIPCYNEEEGIPNLKKKLIPVVKNLKKDYQVKLIFVDDGSTDNTYKLLRKNFRGSCILRHVKNKNLGAALKTGFNYAVGDKIAVLDSDCTYNPDILYKLLDSDADIVTVSPYHPKGEVKNVPFYRVFLSKGISFIYRILTRRKIYTFTAMVRVYKRKVLDDITIENNDFISMVEILIKAIKRGYVVDEVPAVLNVRKHGISKMNTWSAIKGHIKFIFKIRGIQ